MCFFFTSSSFCPVLFLLLELRRKKIIFDLLSYSFFEKSFVKLISELSGWKPQSHCSNLISFISTKTYQDLKSVMTASSHTHAAKHTQVADYARFLSNTFQLTRLKLKSAPCWLDGMLIVNEWIWAAPDEEHLEALRQALIQWFDSKGKGGRISVVKLKISFFLLTMEHVGLQNRQENMHTYCYLGWM